MCQGLITSTTATQVPNSVIIHPVARDLGRFTQTTDPKGSKFALLNITGVGSSGFDHSAVRNKLESLQISSW
jgi:hypothetical protein